MSDKRTATVAQRLSAKIPREGVWTVPPSAFAASLTRCFVSSGILRAKGDELRTIEIGVANSLLLQTALLSTIKRHKIPIVLIGRETAAQENWPGIGRIRMRHIVDASAASLVPTRLPLLK
jgi:hypothetical protein